MADKRDKVPRPTSLGAWLAESPHTRCLVLRAATTVDDDGRQRANPGWLHVVARINVIDAAGRPTLAAMEIQCRDEFGVEDGEVLAAEIHHTLERFLSDRGALERRVRFVNGKPVVDRPNRAAGDA